LVFDPSKAIEQASHQRLAGAVDYQRQRRALANRVTPQASAEVAFTKTEIKLLDRIAGNTKSSRKRTINHYLTAVAKLGGYLARRERPTPRKHGAVARTNATYRYPLGI
jgi:hypothetical protein